MRVPARIYASARLLEDIRRDQTLDTGPQRRLPARHRGRSYRHARRPPGLRFPDRRRRGLRPGRGRSSRRAGSATTSTAASGSSGRTSRRTTSPPSAGSSWPRSSGRSRPGWGRAASRSSAGPCSRTSRQGRGVGRRERLRPEGGPREDRGARPDEDASAEDVSERALERGHPPARHARRGQPFPGDPEGPRDLRRGRGPGLRAGGAPAGSWS